MTVPVVAIGGPPGAGKTIVATMFRDALAQQGKSMVHFDLSPYTLPRKWNHYDPFSFQVEYARRHLRALKRGEPITQPVYEPGTRRRLEQGLGVLPGDVVIVDHYFALTWFEAEADLSIYLSTNVDTCRERFYEKQTRDPEKGGYGRSRLAAMLSWHFHVGPAMRNYIRPSGDNAVRFSGDYKRRQIMDQARSTLVPRLLDLVPHPA